MTGEWRRLHNKELYALYCSSNTIWVKKSRWVDHVECIGESSSAYRVLGGRPGKEPLGRPRCRCEDNPRFRWEDDIKMDLQDMK